MESIPHANYNPHTSSVPITSSGDGSQPEGKLRQFFDSVRNQDKSRTGPSIIRQYRNMLDAHRLQNTNPSGYPPHQKRHPPPSMFDLVEHHRQNSSMSNAVQLSNAATQRANPSYHNRQTKSAPFTAEPAFFPHRYEQQMDADRAQAPVPYETSHRRYAYDTQIPRSPTSLIPRAINKQRDGVVQSPVPHVRSQPHIQKVPSKDLSDRNSSSSGNKASAMPPIRDAPASPKNHHSFPLDDNVLRLARKLVKETVNERNRDNLSDKSFAVSKDTPWKATVSNDVIIAAARKALKEATLFRTSHEDLDETEEEVEQNISGKIMNNVDRKKKTVEGGRTDGSKQHERDRDDTAMKKQSIAQLADTNAAKVKSKGSQKKSSNIANSSSTTSLVQEPPSTEQGRNGRTKDVQKRKPRTIKEPLSPNSKGESIAGEKSEKDDGLVKCDFCGRRFNESSAPRHIGICSKNKHRSPLKTERS